MAKLTNVSRILALPAILVDFLGVTGCSGQTLVGADKWTIEANIVSIQDHDADAGSITSGHKYRFRDQPSARDSSPLR